MPSPPDYCTPQYLLSFLFFFEKTFVLSKLHIDKFSKSMILLELTTHEHFHEFPCNVYWSSPRPISMSQLNTLLYLHLSPINLMFFKGSY